MCEALPDLSLPLDPPSTWLNSYRLYRNNAKENGSYYVIMRLFRGYIGIMETTIMGVLGIMKKRKETTVMGWL